MKVLIACEESQAVCKAFRERGHEAYSCDLIECSGGHPEWHIRGDVLPLLNGFCSFRTQNMSENDEPIWLLQKWDLIVAHPPCTRLCNSGQRWLYWGDDKYKSQKIAEQQKAIVFFMMFALADCERIAIENPSGIMSTAYRKPDCVYNPYDFEGETECKKTCLWLKGLEPLKPTREVPLPKEERTQGIWKAHFGDKKLAWNDPETARLRSQTPLGVAKAMAEQWGNCE
jgi:hypothetical protein